MRKKFSTKLHILPSRHREIRLFMINRYSNMEEGIDLAVRVSLEECKNSTFRKQFLALPGPPTGVSDDSKEHVYWLEHTLKDPIIGMCEIFRKEFGLSTITFGRNAFLYRAIHYFMENQKEL